MNRFRLPLMRVVCCAALAVCMAQVLDEWLPAPAFCSVRAGCEEVVRSRIGRPFEIPLSAIGLYAFAVFYALTLWPGERTGRMIRPLALAAGAGGLCLIGIQLFVLRRTCPLCLLVDSAAIGLAAIELALPRGSLAPPGGRRSAWIGLALFSLAVPLGWVAFKPDPAPPPYVQQLWQEGRLNIVEITDFACPHCRHTDEPLRRLLAMGGDRVHFRRIVVSVKQSADWRTAAKLYLMAERIGRGDEAAAWLFSADAPTREALAAAIGVDPETLSAGMEESALDAMLEERLAAIKADGVGLPQVWIDGTLLVGEQTEESLRAGLQRAEQRRMSRSR